MQANQEAARLAERRLEEQARQIDKKLQEARDEFVSGKKDLEQAQSEVVRLNSECFQAWEDLPELQRQHVSAERPVDWLATAYPSETDLGTVRAEAGKLTAAKQSLLAAEKVQEQWAKLKTQENAVLATLQRLQTDLPPDRAAVRREHQECKLQDEVFRKSIAEHRAAIKETDRDLDRLSKDREKSHQQWVETSGQVKTQEDSQRRAGKWKQQC